MSEIDQNNPEPLGESDTVTQPVAKTKTPSFYKVILLNDDFTPRDFVVHLLQKFFNLNEAKATQVMMEVHQKGSGTAGVFTFEVAETKCFQVNQYAGSHQFPLKCTLEKD